MSKERAEEIRKLEEQLATLKAEDEAERMKRYDQIVKDVTKDMTVHDMIKFRDVLTERIRDTMASDALDDE